MYGFTEAPGLNIFDFVDVEVDLFKTAAAEMNNREMFPSLNKRLDYLFGEDGILEGVTCFTFGVDGILTYEHLSLFLKVLELSDEDFKNFDPEWGSDSDESTSSEDDNDKFDCLSYKKALLKFNPSCVTLLQTVCDMVRTKYTTHLQRLNKMKLTARGRMVARIQKVSNMVENQINILQNLTTQS